MRNAPAPRWIAVGLAPVIVFIAIVLLLCATPSKADAQVTGTWTCGSSTQCGTVMGAMTGFRTFSTLEECHAWGRLNIPGGYSCEGSGTSNSGIRIGNVSAFSALLQMGILGGGLGAGGGSMAKHKNGEDMTLEGGLAGAGFWGLMSMAANQSNRSFAGSVVVGTATGCAAGNAGGLYLDNDAKGTSTTPIDDSEKQVTKYTAAGCAAGFVAGAALPALMNKLPPVRWLRRSGRNPALINNGHKVGVLVLW